ALPYMPEGGFLHSLTSGCLVAGLVTVVGALITASLLPSRRASQQERRAHFDPDRGYRRLTTTIITTKEPATMSASEPKVALTNPAPLYARVPEKERRPRFFPEVLGLFPRELARRADVTAQTPCTRSPSPTERASASSSPTTRSQTKPPSEEPGSS